MRRLILAALMLTSVIGGAESTANEEYALVCRCFFVYAAVFEAGRDLNHPGLFIYGQKRVAWSGGYAAARKSDVEFKSAFESKLQTNKQNARHVKDGLVNAMRSENRNEFAEALRPAASCDQGVGLPSTDIPSM